MAPAGRKPIGKVAMTPAERSRRFRERHPGRALAAVKKYETENREKVLAGKRKWAAEQAAAQRVRMGLPLPTRPEPDACEGCGKTKAERWRNAALCADHDHATGKFRGWLCTSCNIGIGNLGDTLEGVERAAAYLRRAT
jgi:hypothetical protein